MQYFSLQVNKWQEINDWTHFYRVAEAADVGGVSDTRFQKSLLRLSIFWHGFKMPARNMIITT